MMSLARKLAILADAADDAADDAPGFWCPSPAEYDSAEEQATYLVYYELAHRAWSAAARAQLNRTWHHLAEAVSA